jgi:ATP-binding cassette subfamily B protein
MLLASFAEILSIGAVLPFLGVLTAPERIFKLPIAQPFIQALELNQPSELLLPLTIVFGFAALLAGGLRLLLLWASTKLSYAAGADLSIDIYQRTLYQPYAVHCARNSSETIDGITNKTNGVIIIIAMMLSLVSSGMMLITILLALLTVEPFISLLAFGGFGFIYIAITQLTRKKLAINSERMARESTYVIKSLQEGLGGIRDVLIDGSQATYCEIYSNADLPLRRAQGSSSFIGLSPRYAIEALGMLLIAWLAYSLTQQSDGVARTIPILGALALGAQRLLPVMQQAYYSWSRIKSGQVSLQDALELLDQTLPDYAGYPEPQALAFNSNITLKQISFRYNFQTPYVLKDVNLSIAKGSRVGFMGPTGGGKSTLLDIVMGLLHPTDGMLEVDNEIVAIFNKRAWQAHIAHVPQTIYLADSSVEENIAFGIPKEAINVERVRFVAKQAKIADTIESWPNQYQTFVGERGIRLSGGQRQRIGIARALYKQADVIIFDEATSALDNETEQSIMDAIDSLSKDFTLIIIAHRLTTLKKCSTIFELENGSIKRSGSYQELVGHRNH